MSRLSDKSCKVLGQYRSTQRHTPEPDDYEKRLVARIIALATKYGRSNQIILSIIRA